MASEDFAWTLSELRTYQGFYVAPQGPNPEREQTSYMVLRYDDERSSELCRQIENMADQQGGIVFDDPSAVKRGFSSSYRTGLFHRNCRCRLIPKPKALPDQLDELDELMATEDSSLANNEISRLREEMPEDVLEKYLSPEFQRRKRMVISVNESGKHYLHDRRGRGNQ